MDLLDRYLQAVKFWLPRAQQDDIVAELSEDLRAQIEEQETKLGRQLNETETAAILKQRGRPLLVANRYLPQQSLIGPVLFPVYRFVLKIVVLCSLVPPLMAWIGRMTFDPSYRSTHSIGIAVIGAWGPFWVTAFIAVGVVTIVFAVLERAQSHSRFLEDWDPRKLRPVHDPNRIPRVNSVFELAITVVLVMWWVNGTWSQTLFDHAGGRIVLAPSGGFSSGRSCCCRWPTSPCPLSTSSAPIGRCSAVAFGWFSTAPDRSPSAGCSRRTSWPKSAFPIFPLPGPRRSPIQ